MNQQALHLVINIGTMLFFEDDDDENEEPLVKVYNYAEEVVPRFQTHQFKMHFRMLPETFESVLKKVNAVKDLNVRRGHPEVNLDKQLMIFIWCLANKECFRSIADRYGISVSSCWSILYRMCKLFLKINDRYGIIHWPSEARAADIARHYEQISNIRGIIGVVDGSHIEIEKPKEHPNSYINRKNYPSIVLQGICDHKKLFIDVYAGEPGSMHDARVFSKSSIFHKIQNNELHFPHDSHLIGDLAYRLTSKLLVGYKNYGNLTNRQKNFNYKLSQARVTIENTFGYLKCRFRRLTKLDTKRLDLIALLTVCGCILHNICILHGDLPEEIVNVEELRQHINGAEMPLEIHVDYNIENEAVAKRNRIATNLPLLPRFRGNIP